MDARSASSQIRGSRIPAESSQERAYGAMDHLRDPAPAPPRKVADERLELVRLTGHDLDPLDPSNPFALAPTFPWDAYHPPLEFAHPELRTDWRWGTLSLGGAPIKTYSRGFLLNLVEVVDGLSFLIDEFDIEVGAWYEFEPLDPTLGAMALRPVVVGEQRVPRVIQMNAHAPDRAALYSLGIHELAHCPRRGSRPGGFNDHGRRFRENHGTLLAYFLENDPPLDWQLYRALRYYAAEEDHPPIYPWDSDSEA